MTSGIARNTVRRAVAGADPQARPREAASLSCRLAAIPSVDRIRTLLTWATGI
jgi:hypothetical protein